MNRILIQFSIRGKFRTSVVLLFLLLFLSMASLKHPLIGETSNPQNNNKSNPETNTIHESNTPALGPGVWRFPKKPKNCCIYRVPNSIRSINPEAYTPQLVILGPLHHSLKPQALKSRENITSTKSMGYLNMEEHKKIYLSQFTDRVEGKKTIDGFRRIIKEDEEIIRASYSESTTWIPSEEFVNMILLDSVFILEFILLTCRKRLTKTGDPLLDEICLEHTVKSDLILLENQLPLFILEKLFNPIVPTLVSCQTVRQLVIIYFELKDNIRNNSEFMHFTDLVRLVRVETLPEHAQGGHNYIKYMYNADKLDNGGVKFEVADEEFSLYVKFENGCLKMPFLRVSDEVEMTLRNIMALEQCHYPLDTHVCNYVVFLDYLIDTHKDVDLLVEKGIIENWIGNHHLVAKMVNKLCLGTVDCGSYYSDIAVDVNAHYSNRVNKSWTILKRVYFGNPWAGTATVAAMLLLLMTLIQTVSSIIQIRQKNKI